jgi:tetratricopeptide (TPR) repeat protein
MNTRAQAAIQRGQVSFFAEPPDLAAAIVEFSQATELAPEWSEGFGWLAAALGRSGHLDDALEEATRAIELSNDDPRHWISLGTILLALKRWDEAVRTLRRGIELKPYYAEADACLILADALEDQDKSVKPSNRGGSSLTCSRLIRATSDQSKRLAESSGRPANSGCTRVGA